MDAKQLAEIKAREQAATPGPWEYTDNGFDGYISSKNGDFLIGGEPCEGRIEHDANTEFICHARTDIPALIAEVERLEDENEKMKPFYRVSDDTYKHWENAAFAMRDQERAKNAAKDQQISTLEKALRMACGKIGSALTSRGDEWYDYYLKQVQEQEGLSNG